jgi:hypothetical protein
LDRSEGNISSDSINMDTHAIAGRGQSDHHGAAISMSQAQPTRQNAFDDKFNAVFIEILIVQVLCSALAARHAALMTLIGGA